MRGVAATAAVLACLVAAAPANAQAGDPTPVVGSGSFGEAPLLEAGVTYSDSVVSDEVLYYAVELRPGQRLRAEVSADALPEGFSQLFGLSATVFDPLRRKESGNTETADPGETATVESEPAGPRSVSQATEDEPGPGTWYVGVYGVDLGSTDDREELPFELTVTVEGEAAPSEQTPTPTPEATPAPEPDEGGGGGPSGALVGGAAVLGVALGTAGGFRIRRR